MSSPEKIGVVIVPFGSVADRTALIYLILYMNSIQRSFEYQILPFLGTGLMEKVMPGVKVDRLEVEREMPSYLSQYRKHLQKSCSSYRLNDDFDFPFVFLSTCTFSDNYYQTGGKGWGMISLGNWERVMAPPSILEFFLTLLVRVSVDKVSTERMDRHFGTIGCCFDFNSSLSSLRYSILIGLVCTSCTERLESIFDDHVAIDVSLLLRRLWLGTSSHPSEVAIVTKKMGYDLFHTSGIKVTWWDRVRESFEKEFVRSMFKILVLLVGSYFVVKFGL